MKPQSKGLLQTVWVIVNEHGDVVSWTMTPWRGYTIKEVAEEYRMTWSELKKQGYRCVKCELREMGK